MDTVEEGHFKLLLSDSGTVHDVAELGLKLVLGLDGGGCIRDGGVGSIAHLFELGGEFGPVGGNLILKGG